MYNMVINCFKGKTSNLLNMFEVGFFNMLFSIQEQDNELLYSNLLEPGKIYHRSGRMENSGSSINIYNNVYEL